MALIHVDYYTQTLKRMAGFEVILPLDTEHRPPYRTLYLLHGLTGNSKDWLTYTRIAHYAMKAGLAVVMPSGENSFYVDTPVKGSAFGDFGAYVGQELVEITREMFPLSRKREDTFICGLSMGGFGAIRNGLKYGEIFGGVAVLSGAVHFYEMPEDWVRGEGNTIGELMSFEPLNETRNSDRNPRWLADRLVERCAESGLALPRVYVACGTEDALITANRSLAKVLREKRFDVTYEDGPGIHDWDFWDAYIQRVLVWMTEEHEGGH